MKSLILTISMILLGLLGFGQDMIITHADESISCTVIELSDASTKFKYPNEDVIVSLSNNIIHKIIFSSGREKLVSEKIVINGVEDWKKVQITNSESEVIGLKKVDTFSKRAQGSSWTNQGKLDEKVMIRIKKDAAAAGCHMVLILARDGKSGGGPYSYANSSMTAIGYSY
jgi:hypothetical protein